MRHARSIPPAPKFAGAGDVAHLAGHGLTASPSRARRWRPRLPPWSAAPRSSSRARLSVRGGLGGPTSCCGSKRAQFLSYEPVDTKLARETTAGAILQLCVSSPPCSAASPNTCTSWHRGRGSSPSALPLPRLRGVFPEGEARAAYRHGRWRAGRRPVSAPGGPLRGLPVAGGLRPAPGRSSVPRRPWLRRPARLRTGRYHQPAPAGRRGQSHHSGRTQQHPDIAASLPRLQGAQETPGQRGNMIQYRQSTCHSEVRRDADFPAAGCSGASTRMPYWCQARPPPLSLGGADALAIACASAKMSPPRVMPVAVI